MIEKYSQNNQINPDNEIKIDSNERGESSDFLFEQTEKIFEKIESLENKTDLTKEDKEAIKTIKNKFYKISRRFLKITGGMTLLGLIASSENYYKTKYETTAEKDSKGNTVYKHSDTETTHILNYFSGRETLTEEEITYNIRLLAKNSAKVFDIELPPDFDNFNLEQIDSFFASVPKTKLKKGDMINFVDDYVDREIKPAEDIYELIWQLEKECNNPKIKFVVNPPSFLTDNLTINYSSLKNAIYIDILAQGGGPDDLIAELAHSKQFRGSLFKRIIKDLRYTKDLIKVFLRGGFNTERLNEEYSKLYAEKGTIEYEAHSEIAPELKEKYEKLTKSIKEGKHKTGKNEWKDN